MIAVGVKHTGPHRATTTWYRAHSLNRRPDGSLVVFGTDQHRTPYVIPARLFAGAASDRDVECKADLCPERFNVDRWTV